MNECDRKEVMNLIKFRKMMKAREEKKISFENARMIYPQKWDFEDVDFKKELIGSGDYETN